MNVTVFTIVRDTGALAIRRTMHCSAVGNHHGVIPLPYPRTKLQEKIV